MTEFFYIAIITTLFLIIFILVGRIDNIKKQHKRKLSDLYKILSRLTDEKKNSLQKMQLDDNIRELISDAKKKLNEDIFDLQMDVFRKIAEN